MLGWAVWKGVVPMVPKQLTIATSNVTQEEVAFDEVPAAMFKSGLILSYKVIYVNTSKHL